MIDYNAVLTELHTKYDEALRAATDALTAYQTAIVPDEQALAALKLRQAVGRQLHATDNLYRSLCARNVDPAFIRNQIKTCVICHEERQARLGYPLCDVCYLQTHTAQGVCLNPACPLAECEASRLVAGGTAL